MEDALKQHLRRIPSVDKLVRDIRLGSSIAVYGRDLVTFAVRDCLAAVRSAAVKTGMVPEPADLVSEVQRRCRELGAPSLLPLINASGIILHTNLGRAPLGKKILEEISRVCSGYGNLEFDLVSGRRGDRNAHIDSIVRLVTGAEDALVVNNNAAATLLVLSCLAKGREVIVSRGELVEIGGSFRLPEILAEAGATLVEVGTTNRTRVTDYQRAITPQTALIFKAHRSNFALVGFTEEPPLTELVALGNKHAIPVMYDMGSGLLRKPAGLPLAEEPDVADALSQGVDLLSFSGDKLLSGPQAGIIVGRRALVERLRHAPLFRALRVCKLTIAALGAAIRAYLDDSNLTRDLPLFTMLNTPLATLQSRARLLAEKLVACGVKASTCESFGRCGGGTLPNLTIPSCAVLVSAPDCSRAERSRFAERLHLALLHGDQPLLTVLRHGEVLLDLLTIDATALDLVAELVVRCLNAADAADTADTVNTVNHDDNPDTNADTNIHTNADINDSPNADPDASANHGGDPGNGSDNGSDSVDGDSSDGNHCQDRWSHGLPA